MWGNEGGPVVQAITTTPTSASPFMERGRAVTTGRPRPRCRASTTHTIASSSTGRGSLKAYLITTGSIFALIALAHLVRTTAESQRLAADPWFYLEGPGLGLVAAALSFWAWRLLRRSTRG